MEGNGSVEQIAQDAFSDSQLGWDAENDPSATALDLSAHSPEGGKSWGQEKGWHRGKLSGLGLLKTERWSLSWRRVSGTSWNKRQ